MLAKSKAIAVSGVTQYGSGSHLIGQRLLDQLQSNLAFGGKGYLRWHSGFSAPLGVFSPALRQIKSPTHRRCHKAIANHQLHADLTIGLLADRSAILMRYSDRMLALFEPSGLIGNPCLNRLKMRNDFPTKHPPKLLFIPRTIGNKLLQSLRIYTKPCCHRFNGLTLPSHQQAGDITCRSYSPLTTAQRCSYRHHERFKSLNASLPQSGVPLHARSSCGKMYQLARKYLTQSY